MKKILRTVFLIGLFLTGEPLWAAGVTSPLSTLSELRTAVLNQLYSSTGGTALISKTVANEAINRAQLKVASDFPAYEKLDTVKIQAVITHFCELPDDFLKLNWVIRFTGDAVVALEYVPPQYIYNRLRGREPNYAQQGDTAYPRYCFVAGLFEDPKLFFWPPGKAAGGYIDSFYVSYYAVPREMTDDTMKVLIDYGYREPLVFWACADLAYRIGRLDLGDRFVAVYKELLAMSKASEIKQPFYRGYPLEAAGK